MRSRKVIVSCSAVIFLKEMGFLQFKIVKVIKLLLTSMQDLMS